MRFTITIIFLLLSSLKTNAQSEKDTIDRLFNLSEKYYEDMYVNKHFDSASKLWDKRVIPRLKQIYKMGEAYPGDSFVMAKIKASYYDYFQTIKKFEFFMFGYHYSNKSNEPLEIMLSFYYKIVDDKKSKKIPTAIFFRPIDNGEWELYDLIILDIAEKYKLN